MNNINEIIDNTKNNDSKNNEEDKINAFFEKQNFTIKNDIIFFKNDLLKELKNLKEDCFSKCNHIGIELLEKIKEISDKNIELNNKIEFISSTIDSKILNNLNNEINFEKIAEDIKKNLFSNEIKIESLKADLNTHIEQYNNIIKNNILYKGIIGPGCKYINMHQFIDFIILNINNLNNFKEEKTYDNKMYKMRIESALENINNNTNNIIESCKLYVNQRIKELQEKLNSGIKLNDSRLIELRVENVDNSKKIEKKLNEINEDFKKIISIKNNIYEIAENAINKISESNNNTANLFNEYQKEFKLIKNHFNLLADFIKDKKSRINASNLYNKHELFNIANKIGFDRKIKSYENSPKKNISGEKIEIKSKIDDNIKKYVIKNEKRKKIKLSADNDDNIINSHNMININDNFNINNEINKKEINENKSFGIIEINKEKKREIILNNNNIKIIPNKNNKKDENTEKDSYVLNNYDNENIINNENYIIHKKLKNEKLEKYNFLYDNNDNYKIKKDRDLSLKNFSNKNNMNKTNDNYKIKNREKSAFPRLKINLLNLHKNKDIIINKNVDNIKNDIDNFTSKDLYENCLFASGNFSNKNEENIHINNLKNNYLFQKIKENKLRLERNNFSNSSLNKTQIIDNMLSTLYNNKNNENNNQNYTNRNKYNLEINNIINKDSNTSIFEGKINKYSNINKSMENMPVINNEESLFYKNLSNNKLKIKNLSCIK